MIGEDSSDPRFADVIINRVLLVEDDADTAEFIKTMLEREKYTVFVARDGGQAQSFMFMRKPDFVILDLILPGETGFEICERFKQTEKELPVLVLSAIDMPDARALAKRVGADNYLTKPFEPQVLLDTIKQTARTVWLRTHGELVEEREISSAGDDRVRFKCKCGKKFKVSPTHRGKSLTCPNCGESVIVPRHN